MPNVGEEVYQAESANLRDPLAACRTCAMRKPCSKPTTSSARASRTRWTGARIAPCGARSLRRAGVLLKVLTRSSDGPPASVPNSTLPCLELATRRHAELRPAMRLLGGRVFAERPRRWQRTTGAAGWRSEAEHDRPVAV